MTMKTLKKTEKNVGVFLVFLVVSATCVPILATIASIVLGIVSVFLILAMPIACFFTNGRKRLSNPFKHLPTLKLFHFPFLLFIVALVLFTPALFALSLILHWHLAAQIILGIVASLLVLAITVVSFFLISKSHNTSLTKAPKLKTENNEKCVSATKEDNNLDKSPLEIGISSNIQTGQNFSDNIEVEKEGKSSMEEDLFGNIQNVFSNLEDEDMDEKDSISDYGKNSMLDIT